MTSPSKSVEEGFVDVSSESVSAKWSSLMAPLMPSLLLSREACFTLFDTPWRAKSSRVMQTRQAALYVLQVFENDMECQKSWLSFCGKSLQSCVCLTAGEVIGWSYTFIFLIATLVGASSVSSALGLGSIVYRMYLIGCAQSFVSFVYEMVCLLQDGPFSHAKALVRAKAKTFVLSMVASLVLPKDVLAAHMTACVLFGFMEKVLKCIFRLSIPSMIILRNIKDMGNAYASRLVSAVLVTLRVSNPPVAILPQLLDVERTEAAEKSSNADPQTLTIADEMFPGSQTTVGPGENSTGGTQQDDLPTDPEAVVGEEESAASVHDELEFPELVANVKKLSLAEDSKQGLYVETTYLGTDTDRFECKDVSVVRETPVYTPKFKTCSYESPYRVAGWKEVLRPENDTTQVPQSPQSNLEGYPGREADRPLKVKWNPRTVKTQIHRKFPQPEA